MQLDKFTDYALRMLVALAMRAPERATASAIAQAYRISEHHMAKVASQLAREGFVISERGRGGGLTLARDPAQINIGAVVRALKADSPVVACFGSDKSCVIMPACGLRTPLQRAQEAFFAVLDEYTLADVTTSRAGLSALLTPQT
ncbi:transcriptional regulator, BadM/Rrf2 family [Yoonia tamlensis]|uniref:Transcriptional regulator, BadM/Rrf2 family n=2 Tax=Yoonia tamlensis TaxID=390270 RepID=A0A1I6GK05_9RHOB|nr:transcriptional regulator, BadM/Rrf2 family [Yoonia tamlensis]